MKRRTFLKATLATAPLTLDSALFASHLPDRKGFKVAAGEGRYHGHIQLKGVNENILDVKVSGKDTAGQLAIFEQTNLSPNGARPCMCIPFRTRHFACWKANTSSRLELTSTA
jgi:hypothetical protein